MMMSSSNSCNSSGRNQIEYYTHRAPFTPTQYQELEHQALIYKYLVSGVPIPHHLLSSVRNTTSAAIQSTVGWGCFQIGFGGKKVDPEPGRCRRTDGKKWRCAKEAYPDSKYCEKHMHRGKNRSKNSKPLNLQVLISDSPTATSTVTSANSSSSSSTPSSISTLSQNYALPTLSDYTNAYSNYQHGGGNYYESNSLYPFLSPHASVGAAPSSGFCGQDRDTQQLLLGSSSGNITNKHSRYWGGIKEDAGERSFFPEASRTMKGVDYESYPPSAIPLTMNSPNYHYPHHLQQYQYYGVARGNDQDQQSEGDSAPNSRETSDSNNNNAKNPFHQFFGEWPGKNSADSWLEDNDQGAGKEDDRDSCHQEHSGPASTTQLSM